MLSFLLTNSMFPYDIKINFYHHKPTSTLKKLKTQKRPCRFCGKAFLICVYFFEFIPYSLLSFSVLIVIFFCPFGYFTILYYIFQKNIVKQKTLVLYYKYKN